MKQDEATVSRCIKPRIASPRAVVEMTGLSRTTLWRLGRAGEFPTPIRISAGRVGYLIEDVEAWIAERKEQTS